MRLNPDLIRDLLLYLEENTGIDHDFTLDQFDKIPAPLDKYSYEEILYHVKQCKMMDYLVNAKFFVGGGFMIDDITPKAHEFLADIRSDSNWNEVKAKAKAVGSFSLAALSQIAAQVISSKLGG